MCDLGHHYEEVGGGVHYCWFLKKTTPFKWGPTLRDKIFLSISRWRNVTLSRLKLEDPFFIWGPILIGDYILFSLITFLD